MLDHVGAVGQTDAPEHQAGQEAGRNQPGRAVQQRQGPPRRRRRVRRQLRDRRPDRARRGDVDDVLAEEHEDAQTGKDLTPVPAGAEGIAHLVEVAERRAECRCQRQHHDHGGARGADAPPAPGRQPPGQQQRRQAGQGELARRGQGRRELGRGRVRERGVVGEVGPGVRVQHEFQDGRRTGQNEDPAELGTPIGAHQRPAHHRHGDQPGRGEGGQHDRGVRPMGWEQQETTGRGDRGRRGNRRDQTGDSPPGPSRG